MSCPRQFVLSFAFLLFAGPFALLAQNNSIIDQARLFRESNTAAALRDDPLEPTAAPVDDDSGSADDSMGVQQILKEQEKRPTFTISGGLSEIFTSNAALTRRDERHDVFFVADVSATWTPRLSPTVEADIGGRASVFRYVRTPELDFESLAAGAGITWSPESLSGFSISARYDLTQLLDTHGDHILLDNDFTLNAQKVVIIGNAHAVTIGVTGSLDFSDPISAQRHQLGASANYHVQIARDFSADLLWRPVVHYYEELGRSDFNNILSLTLRYRLNKYADLSAFGSYGVNRSDSSAFDYEVFTTGAAVVLSLRF